MPTLTAPAHSPRGSTRASRVSHANLRSASVDEITARQRLERQIHGALLSTYLGRRNVSLALGYEPTLRPRDYRARYERGGIAARIVDFFPCAAFTKGAMLVETDDPDQVTQFEDQTAQLLDRLDGLDKLKRAAILAGLGRYSVLVIGTVAPKGSAPGDLSTELPRMSGPDQIGYLQPLSEDRAQLGKLDTEPTSARFGLPVSYNINFGSSAVDGGGIHLASREVHWSRVIHIARGTLEDDIYGDPILRRVWNYLDDLDKIEGGGAEAAWRRMDPGLHLNLDKELELNDTQEDELLEHLDEYQHGLRRTLTTRGAEVTPLNASVATFKANVETIISLISAATGISQRILAGSERGQLASEQDRNNTGDRITEYKDFFAWPVTRALIQRLIDYGALVTPAQFTIAWPEEDQLTEVECADVALKYAQANRTSGKTIITTSEIRDRVLGMEPLEESELEQAPQPTVPVPPNTTPAPEILTATAHLSSDRVVIIGGPRMGKSTLARHLRTSRALPTYCGDPESLVKDREPDVTYLPDNLAWSEGSQHIADVWLASAGPWCVEGVAVVRALRKLVDSGRVDLLEGVDIVHLTTPQANVSSGQASMAKGVETVWREIASYFPQAVEIATQSAAEPSGVMGATVARRTRSLTGKRSIVGAQSVAARKSALFKFKTR